MAPVVADADPVNPRFTVGWLDYAAARGFGTDPARVRHAQDKPRVERVVPCVRENFFRGEDFLDLADAQHRVQSWCATTAGMRMHGTTAQRPAEHFAATEAALLLCVPTTPYDMPIFTTAKVARDHHIEVARGLYWSTRGTDRAAGVGAGRLGVGEDLQPWAAGQDPPTGTTRWALDRPE
jgi:hypothetical protein